jgi:hypothetical protein
LNLIHGHGYSAPHMKSRAKNSQALRVLPKDLASTVNHARCQCLTS